MKKFFFCLLVVFLYFTSFAQIKTNKIYSNALKAFNEQRYEETIRLFDEFFKTYSLMDEMYATAKYYSSEALLKLGETDAAAGSFEFLANNFLWSDFRYKALYNLGKIYFVSEQYEKSRVKFNKLIKDYPSSEFSGAAFYWIGESFVREKNYDEAISFLKQAIENKAYNKLIDYSIFELAKVYELINDYQNAVKYYDQLLSFYSNSPLAPSAQIRIGMAYFKLKDYQASILELNNPILSDMPENVYSESLLLLANSYFRVEDFKNAEKTYSEIIKKYHKSVLVDQAKFGLAWSYFKQKNYNKAFAQFDELSANEDSIGIKSFFWKAEVKRFAGDEADAKKIYLQFLEKYPNNEYVSRVKYQLGLLNFESENFKSANSFLNESVNSFDNETRIRTAILLGEINLKNKDYDAANRYLSEALTLPSNNTELKLRLKFGLALVRFYKEDIKTAKKMLEDIKSENPSFEQNKINFYLAECYFNLANYNDAISFYNQISIGSDELSALTLYGKAYSYFNLGDYRNSIIFFTDFIKHFPKNNRIIDAKLRLADSYYGNKNFNSASQIYTELFSSRKSILNDPSLYYQYAQTLFRAGKTDKAIEEFENLVRKYPKSAYADKSLYVIGWIKFQNGKFEESIVSYRNLLDKYPSSELKPIIYYSIGDAFFNSAQYDSAIVNYQRVLIESPTSQYVYDALNGIQYSYIAKGENEKAIKLIDEFVSRNPSLSFSDQLFYKKGEIYYNNRDYKMAKESYQQFIINYPDSRFVPEAYYWIGKSSEYLNNNEDAMLSFSKIFLSYPNSETAPQAVIELGNVYNQLKQYDKSVKLYEAALEKFGRTKNYPEILFMKGRTLLLKKDTTAAMDAFDEVSQYYPESVFGEKSKFELGLIEFNAKRFESAELYFKNLAESKTDELGAKAEYFYAWSLFNQNKFTDAITALVRIRTIFSNYDEWLMKSYLLLGDCYVKLNDKKQAEKMYRKILSVHKNDEFAKLARNKIRALK